MVHQILNYPTTGNQTTNCPTFINFQVNQRPDIFFGIAEDRTSRRLSYTSVQMRKPHSPLVKNSSERRYNHETVPFEGGSSSSSKKKGHRKTGSFFGYIRTAANKVAVAFTVFLPTRKRSSEPSAAGARGSSGPVKGLPFSTDISTTSSKSSSSRLKSFSSFASSNANSGPVGTSTFTIDEIIKATGNFSPSNKIGEGGFGIVYKGRLKDGSIVAVKRARKDAYDKHLSSEFKNEILTLSKIEHLNLVRLYGYTEYGDERIIVVEYIGNGTLREHLDGVRGSGMEISQRLDIAIDVAHAITYLHMYTEPPVIHRDIKSSNILITEKFRAKVADFGFARLTSGDFAVTHISTQVKGTTGYLDPEYLRTYQLTEKSDVYSFGVLLVELVTGRYPIEQKRSIKQRVTVKWALQRLKAGETIFAMDPVLRRSPASNAAIEKVLRLAERCVGSVRQSRPSMKECAEILWTIRKELREDAQSSSSSASTSHQSANFPLRDAKKIRGAMYGVEEDEGCRFVSA